MKGEKQMKTPEKKAWTETNYLNNETKDQTHFSKNKVNTTIEKPGINKSGIEAKKKGWVE
jgi:hypothetical protein